MKTLELNLPAGASPTAFDLLAAMRPEMETILQRYAHTAKLPSCRSQSLRALRLAEFLDAKTPPIGTTLGLSFDDLREAMGRSHDLAAIRNFLAVHQTVTLLECIERNGHFDLSQ